jgi:prepilin-type N-terminal cleavage/methylation domain-containing protein/prepilin-type processing-associated H-X9-DG protein
VTCRIGTGRAARAGAKTQSRAFTLVELLVVISIIALLLAILLPSLREARAQAKRTKCLATLRGISVASLTYATDDPQDNSIPVAVDHNDPIFDSDPYWSRYGNYGFGGKSGVGSGRLDGSPLDRPYTGRNRLAASQRPLNRVMYPRGISYSKTMTLADEVDPDTRLPLDAYLCPADTGYKGVHYREWGVTSLRSYDFFGTSYAANIFWTGPNVPTCTMGSNSPYLRQLAKVPNPANTVLYVENVGRYAWQHNDPAAKENGGPFEKILPEPEYDEGRGGPQWHGKGWYYNITYADGHCAYVRIKSYIAFDPYPTNLGGKCAGDGGYCKWILIRGRDWQMDCLPSAPVETRHPCPPEGRPSQDGEDIAGWVQ